MIQSEITSPCPVDVCHYVAGGREHGGGIGRLVGYVLDAQPEGSHHRICDTRGPRWRPVPSAIRLCGAIGSIVSARIAAPRRLHQLHIAGRGSTARKLILASVAHRIGCRYMLHLHDFDYAADFRRRPAWQRSAIRRMFQRADRVIVLGDRDRSTVSDLLGVPASRIRTLRNCVPDPGPRPRPPHQGEPAPVRILFLGQLGPRKGVPELLAALAHPKMALQTQVGPGWRAILAGDGPVENYRAEARALGLSDRVTLPGWLDQARARALCEEADILVLPSHGEGMAMSVLEGLAHGLAVVTTRVGAHDEVLEDGVTCAFVPVGDAGALAETLARLTADPAERARLGTAGRALFEREFGIESYVRRLNQFLASRTPSASMELSRT